MTDEEVDEMLAGVHVNEAGMLDLRSLFNVLAPTTSTLLSSDPTLPAIIHSPSLAKSASKANIQRPPSAKPVRPSSAASKETAAITAHDADSAASASALAEMTRPTTSHANRPTTAHSNRPTTAKSSSADAVDSEAADATSSTSHSSEKKSRSYT